MRATMALVGCSSKDVQLRHVKIVHAGGVAVCRLSGGSSAAAAAQNGSYSGWSYDPPLRNHYDSQFANGIVSSVSFASTTNTARSLAGFVWRALALTPWRSPGSSEKLCQAW